MYAGRMNSQGSISSLGIGTRGTKPSDEENFAKRLMPEGEVPSTLTYDCVVYLIYCSEHDQIAVTNVARTRVVWFPYVAMPEGNTWEQASLDGVTMLIGKKVNVEVEAKLANRKLPKFQMNHLHFLRVQLPGDRFFTRMAQFVNIEPTPDHGCCEDSRSIVWIPAADILNDKVETLWGPEVKLFTTLLINPEQKFIYEFSLDNALLHLSNEMADTFQANLLKTCKISTEQIVSIYQEYVEHCFPAFYMSLESFKEFLIKFGYSKSDPRFPWLFHSVAYNRRGYVDFNEFLIGLICMEPSTENYHEGRIRMLFRYYDTENNDALSVKEFVALIQDLHPTASPERLRILVDQSISDLFTEERKLQFEQFSTAVVEHRLNGTDRLCRSPRAIVPQVIKLLSKKAEAATGISMTASSLDRNGKLKESEQCNGCRTPNYEYGYNCVSFDTNGKCVKPNLLKDAKGIAWEGNYSLGRYSLEIIFNNGNFSTMFIDVVRGLLARGDQNGLIASAEEGPLLARYMKTLCDNLTNLLILEDRVMKINAPAFVIGNIRGRLDSLLVLERFLWQSQPVFPVNLVFLGNYTGGTKFDVEVTSYLFALKMKAPNKVFLLRGQNESRSLQLQNSITGKYGKDVGQFIYEVFNKVFDRLPLAMVIDETILCVHSGIPCGNTFLTNLNSIPGELADFSRNTLANEVITSVPSDSEYRSPSGLTFTAADFSKFMKRNSLNFMIRGHESYRGGYRLNFGAKCIGVSSDEISPMAVEINRPNSLIRLTKLNVEGRKRTTPRSC